MSNDEAYFFVLRKKFFFAEIWWRKIKVVSSRINLVLILTRIYRNKSQGLPFPLCTLKIIFGEIQPNYSKLSKLFNEAEIWFLTNSNMQDLMMVLHSFVLQQ